MDHTNVQGKHHLHSTNWLTKKYSLTLTLTLTLAQTHQSNTPLDSSPGGRLFHHSVGTFLTRQGFNPPRSAENVQDSLRCHNYDAHAYDGHNLMQLPSTRVVPPPAHNGSSRQVNEYIQGVGVAHHCTQIIFSTASDCDV